MTKSRKKSLTAKLHEHRYYTSSRSKSDTCIICGFNPQQSAATNPRVQPIRDGYTSTMITKDVDVRKKYKCFHCGKQDNYFIIPNDQAVCGECLEGYFKGYYIPSN